VPVACLWVDQIWQVSPCGTLPYYLPGSVPIDAEDEHLTFSGHWTTAQDVIAEHP